MRVAAKLALPHPRRNPPALHRSKQQPDRETWPHRPDRLVLTGDVSETLSRHADRCLPKESVCLIGCHRLHVGGMTCWLATTALPLDNLANGTDWFEVAACDFLAARETLRQAGTHRYAFCHSHPAGPAGLSDRDRRELWPLLPQIILTPGIDGSWHATAYWGAPAGDGWTDLEIQFAPRAQATTR